MGFCVTLQAGLVHRPLTIVRSLLVIPGGGGGVLCYQARESDDVKGCLCCFTQAMHVAMRNILEYLWITVNFGLRNKINVPCVCSISKKGIFSWKEMN